MEVVTLSVSLFISISVSLSVYPSAWVVVSRSVWLFQLQLSQAVRLSVSVGDGSRQGHLGSPWKWSEKANKKEPEGLKRGLEEYGEWWESG